MNELNETRDQKDYVIPKLKKYQFRTNAFDGISRLLDSDSNRFVSESDCEGEYFVKASDYDILIKKYKVALARLVDIERSIRAERIIK